MTGLGLFGFVVAHMLGNLQIFLGPQALNVYAHKLESMPELLWPARIGLLTFFVAHIYFAITLNQENRAARPVRYVYEDTLEATYASRRMVMSGLLVLAFVIYHLLHFTFRVVHVKSLPLVTLPGGVEGRDVYSMVVLGFRVWYISLAYLVAQFFLGLHLSHGMTSVFQTLGLSNRRWRGLWTKVGPALALIIVAGNMSIPAAVLAGLVKTSS